MYHVGVWAYSSEEHSQSVNNFLRPVNGKTAVKIQEQET